MKTHVIDSEISETNNEMELALLSLSDAASTLTNGCGTEWPESWNPAYKVH